MSPLLIPLAFEWIALITLIAPLIFVGKFRNKPNLGLVVWFSAFLSAGAAFIVLILALGNYVFSSWLALQNSPRGSENWWHVILASFAPWLFLAISGIALALLNQRLAPLYSAAIEISPLAKLASTRVAEYLGYEVRSIELPFDHAFTDGRAIYVTSQLWQKASSFDRDEILIHEHLHIRLKHPVIKRVAQVIRTLTPTFAASNALEAEVEKLTELIAQRGLAK